MSIYSNVHDLRMRLGYSQDEIANKLGVTRQTYMKFEKGTSELNTSQVEKLANIFGVEVYELYNKVQNVNKFKEMLIYIMSKFNKYGLPKTKLAKLLYLSDFTHYYNELESMSGVLYKCRDYGPLAEPYLELVEEMFDKGEIHIDILEEGAQMLSLSKSVNPNCITLLSDKEKSEIDQIVDKWKTSSSKELINFTHNQKPWMACRTNEIIPYDLILQEEPDNVF